MHLSSLCIRVSELLMISQQAPTKKGFSWADSGSLLCRRRHASWQPGLTWSSPHPAACGCAQEPVPRLAAAHVHDLSRLTQRSAATVYIPSISQELPNLNLAVGCLM